MKALRALQDDVRPLKPSDCASASPLAVFDYNASQWETQAGLLDTLNDRSRWNVAFTGADFRLDSYLGNIQVDASGRVVSANVLRVNFGLVQAPASSGVVDSSTEDLKQAVLGWEKTWLEMILVWLPCICDMVDSVMFGLQYWCTSTWSYLTIDAAQVASLDSAEMRFVAGRG